MSGGSKIPKGWVETTLGEIMNIYSGKTRPKNNGVYPVYGGNGILNYGDSYNQEDDTIIIGRVGAYCGNVFIENEKFWLSDNALGVTNKRNSDIMFLYFLLKHMKLNNVAIGAAQPLLTQTLLRELEITIPQFTDEQQAIAAILTTFDDKIELLQAQNQTLEATAQTIFKEWFGKYQIGDELPEGWRVGKLKDTGEIICGKTPSKSRLDYYGDEIPFIKIPDMHNQMFVLKANDNLTQLGADSQLNKTLPANSICVSCIATVGLVSLTTQVSHTNQQINSIVPSNIELREYLYFTLLSMHRYLNDLGSGGTATLNVNTSTFSNIDLVIPNNEMLIKFHNLQKPLFDKIYSNMQQIQTLQATRDTLLPKLMSGKVRVDEFKE